MKRILHFFVIILFLAAMPPVRAGSFMFLVTPDNPENRGFTFEITSRVISGGMVEFRAVVSAKKATFVHPSTSLSIVKYSATSQEMSGGRDLPSEKKDRSIICVFTVPEKDLADPNLCFVFNNGTEAIVNGKAEEMESADIYIARLKDYFKTQP
jgi:hypothetical protein